MYVWLCMYVCSCMYAWTDVMYEWHIVYAMCVMHTPFAMGLMCAVFVLYFWHVVLYMQCVQGSTCHASHAFNGCRVCNVGHIRMSWMQCVQWCAMCVMIPIATKWALGPPYFLVAKSNLLEKKLSFSNFQIYFPWWLLVTLDISPRTPKSFNMYGRVGKWLMASQGMSCHANNKHEVNSARGFRFQNAKSEAPTCLPKLAVRRLIAGSLLFFLNMFKSCFWLYICKVDMKAW